MPLYAKQRPRPPRDGGGRRVGGVRKKIHYNHRLGRWAAPEPDGGELAVGETVKLAYVDQSRAELNPKKTVFEEVTGEPLAAEQEKTFLEIYEALQRREREAGA